MTRHMQKHSQAMRAGIRSGLRIWALGICLAATTAHAGRVSIAATPGVVSEVEAIALAFEAANPGDSVQISHATEAELKDFAKGLPVQVIASDDLSFIEWLEARELAVRAGPTVYAPMAVVASASTGGEVGLTRDLNYRLQQGDTKIAIPDPAKTAFGRQAQVWLEEIGVSTNSSQRVVVSKSNAQVLELVKTGKAHFGIVWASEALTAKGLTIHAVSGPGAPSSIHNFAVKSGQQDHAGAKRFLAFVTSPEGQNALKSKGMNWRKPRNRNCAENVIERAFSSNP